MNNFIKPPKTILRQSGRAIADYQMIRDQDRILVAVSGGKDSLSLLHILAHFQRHAPVRFQLGVITVDPQIDGFDPSPLNSYYQMLALPGFYESHPMLELAKQHMKKDSFCSYCSRIKRGIMYRVAREQNYNVLALGQHLDDLAESFLMSAFHGGQLRTMKAHYLNDSGDVRVIRPLVYTRERQTSDFAKSAALPVIADTCPACFSKPTQRQYMKELLHKEEHNNKNLFKTLLTTLKPLMGAEVPSREPGKK